jgi:hypothetical protein
MAILAYFTKQGDTAPAITDTLLDKSGAAVNLTGATVKFHAADRLANVVIANGTVTGIGGGSLDTSGGVQYQQTAGDVATAQDLFVEWQVTFSDTRIETWPDSDQAIWRITQQLA